MATAKVEGKYQTSLFREYLLASTISNSLTKFELLFFEQRFTP